MQRRLAVALGDGRSTATGRRQLQLLERTLVCPCRAQQFARGQVAHLQRTSPFLLKRDQMGYGDERIADDAGRVAGEAVRRADRPARAGPLERQESDACGEEQEGGKDAPGPHRSLRTVCSAMTA